MSRRELIPLLQDTLIRTLPHFRQPDAVLDRAYAPGKWSARFILHHLADTETVLLDRLRRVAAEAQPLLWPFDQDRWAAHLAYDRRDLAASAALFDAARRSIIELARQLDPALDTRTGFHTEAGPVGLLDVLKKVARHNAHHLTQLEAIAESRPWSPSI